jgi:hypothetical protein
LTSLPALLFPFSSLPFLIETHEDDRDHALHLLEDVMMTESIATETASETVIENEEEIMTGIERERGRGKETGKGKGRERVIERKIPITVTDAPSHVRDLVVILQATREILNVPLHLTPETLHLLFIELENIRDVLQIMEMGMKGIIQVKWVRRL